MLTRLLDRLLGPRCCCGERVYPKDRAAHAAIEHAGEGILWTP